MFHTACCISSSVSLITQLADVSAIATALTARISSTGYLSLTFMLCYTHLHSYGGLKSWEYDPVLPVRVLVSCCNYPAPFKHVHNPAETWMSPLFKIRKLSIKPCHWAAFLWYWPLLPRLWPHSRLWAVNKHKYRALALQHCIFVLHFDL